MSWRASAWAKEQNGMSTGEKLLLLLVADYYNDEIGSAWPSTERLAKEAGMSVRNTLRLLAKLEQKGVIRISRDSGRVNHYEMGLDFQEQVFEKTTRDKVSPVTKRVSTHDIAMSPEHKEPQKKIRERYEQVFEKVHNVRHPINSPERYFAKFQGNVEFDPRNVAAAIKVADSIRGERPEPLRVPPLKFWPNLDRVGAFLRKENGKLNRAALAEAFDGAFTKVVGNKGGEGWDNILDGVAQAPEEFLSVYREVDYNENPV